MNTTMKPTDADYEQLARALCLARNVDPDEETVISCAASNWEMNCIDDDNGHVVVTRDTLDNFRDSAKKWRESGGLVELENGLFWGHCQMFKGQRRGELCVVDCGEFRLCFRM